MKTITKSIFVFILTFLFSLPTKAQVQIDFESGFVSTGYNDIRIPGDQGTLFSLKDDLSSDTEFFYRIRLNYSINSRHTISLLYAPLETNSEGSKAQDILFQGEVFPANSNIEGTFKFNSYRFTYRYNFIKNQDFELGLGLTAKIRDAKVALSSSGLYSEKANVGFVPLINFRLMWNIDEKFGLLLSGDALAAPQGRAEDVLLAGIYKMSDNIRVRAGYRILEGGADNDEVYNFSLFNYVSAGITYIFNK